jgi:copper(I)-binding protein
MFTLATAFALNLALADDYSVGSLHIDHAHARATVPGQSTGAAYISVENKGNVSDKLLSVASPVAKSAEVHSMAMDGNVMRMREVSELELKPSTRIVMQAGDGYHIMLVGLKQALKPGQKIPLSLRFEKAGKIDIEASVDSR